MQLVSKRFRVWNALIIRALMSRYGRSNLGFAWLILEPLLLMSGVALIWFAIYGSRRHGVLLIPFVITGYSILTLWRHLVDGSVHLLRHNADLLYHKEIGPLDILFAHYSTEIIGILASFFIAYVVALIFNLADSISDFATLLVAWFLMSFFCVGVGLVVSASTEMSEVVERILPPLMYFMLPITGVFAMVAWLPQNAQELILYIPMVHGTEMFRAGYFGEAVPTHWSAVYLLASGIASNAIGVLLLSKAIHRIEA